MVDLEQLFMKYKHLPFIVVRPNQGNWGDELIRMGARKLMDLLQIEYTEFERLHPPYNIDAEAVIYIHGVGGIGRTYPNVARKAWEWRKLNPDAVIIFGPSTAMIGDVHHTQLEDEFREMRHDQNFHFFARERVTYDYMSRNLNLFHVHLSHCPSLYLTVSDFDMTLMNTTKKVLFLREDVFEKPDEIPSQIENQVYDDICDPVNAKTFDDYVRMHNATSIIYTNRCHSAILGMILGKDVTIFPNNYHKNKSIWEHSLKKEGVKWCDELT